MAKKKDIAGDEQSPEMPQFIGVHGNSTKALKAQKVAGKVEKYRRKVFDFLSASKTPKTDRDIFTTLGVSDVNNIRPEITRLKKDGLVREAGRIKCPVTGKTVRTTTVTGVPYFSSDSRKARSREVFYVAVFPAADRTYGYACRSRAKAEALASGYPEAYVRRVKEF